jgi:hypothetical protein
MSFWPIITALLQGTRRFRPAGLFFVAAFAFAGNDSPVQSRSASIDGSKSSYALPGGETSFIMPLTNPAQRRSVTFVNENAEAEGQLSIAVSNHFLTADSPEWGKVEGVIRFQHKRVFRVSLVGVDANYVRLTFEVKMPGRNLNRASALDHLRRKSSVARSLSGSKAEIVIADQASAMKIIRP